MSDYEVCIYTAQENIPLGLLTFVANRATCGACGVSAPRLRCSKCKAAWYCNSGCQRQAWGVHKVSCRRAKHAVCDKIQEVHNFMCKRNMRKGMHATIFSNKGSDFVLYEPECPDALCATIESTYRGSSLIFSKAYRGRLRVSDEGAQGG